MKFNHVGVSVTNLEASMDFYREMLGLSQLMDIVPFDGPDIEAIMDLPGATGRMCMIGNGTLNLELFEFDRSQPRNADYPVSDGGYTHFGVEVDDIDRTYEKLQSAGVRIHSPIIMFEGGMRAAYCRDPDGNVFEIMQAVAPST